MCQSGNQDNVSGWLGIRIMCQWSDEQSQVGWNQDNVSGWGSG